MGERNTATGNVQVAFMRLRDDARLPEYAHVGDAGLDLFAVDATILPPGGRAAVATGIAMALPRGYEGQVRPRSGLALSHGITVLNAPGTIDQGYRGELRVILVNLGEGVFAIEPGMKVAQLVVAPVVHVLPEWVERWPDEPDSTGGGTRGTRGFGSSGR